MFDFPATPTVGQAYTLNGVSYVWNGYAWMAGGAPAPQQGVQYPAHGGCILELVDTANVRVKPYNGNRIIISGESRPILAPTVLNKSLTASNTKLYLYAYWTGTAVAYEFTSTLHTTHTDGVEIMSSDPSRTFLGMIYLYGGTDFRDDASARLVVSWFNRQRKIVTAAAAAVAVTSTTATAIGSPSYFLSFGGDQVTSRVYGQITGNVAGLIALTSPRIDGAGAGENGGTLYAVSAWVGAGGYVGAIYATTALHTLQVFSRVAGPVGTATVTATAEMELWA